MNPPVTPRRVHRSLDRKGDRQIQARQGRLDEQGLGLPTHALEELADRFFADPYPAGDLPGADAVVLELAHHPDGGGLDADHADVPGLAPTTMAGSQIILFAPALVAPDLAGRESKRARDLDLGGGSGRDQVHHGHGFRRPIAQDIVRGQDAADGDESTACLGLHGAPFIASRKTPGSAGEAAEV